MEIGPKMYVLATNSLDLGKAHFLLTGSFLNHVIRNLPPKLKCKFYMDINWELFIIDLILSVRSKSANKR